MLETIKTIFNNTPLFTACRPETLAALSAQSVLQKENKGKVFFVQEDEAARFYIVKAGWVKLFRETLDGTQAVVDILPAGHIFGETSIFEDDIYPYGAEAADDDVEIISAPLSLLKQEIEQNPKFALSMLSAMARYRKQQDKELEHMNIQNASQRIGCFLLKLTGQEAVGPVSIDLPYDKTLVASRLGMQPETFSRALSKLKQVTGIEAKGATIHMESLDQLSDYSCSACSSNFPCKDIDTKSVKA